MQRFSQNTCTIFYPLIIIQKNERNTHMNKHTNTHTQTHKHTHTHTHGHPKTHTLSSSYINTNILISNSPFESQKKLLHNQSLIVINQKQQQLNVHISALKQSITGENKHR